jgi:hypothetical protein
MPHKIWKRRPPLVNMVPLLNVYPAASLHVGEVRTPETVPWPCGIAAVNWAKSTHVRTYLRFFHAWERYFTLAILDIHQPVTVMECLSVGGELYRELSMEEM